MPPLLRSVIYLRPPKGPVLVLKDEETWIGRGSFELSEKSQSVCSRRQACLKHTKAVVQLECHGLNPIHFVVCQSVSFQANQQDIPLSSLHLLRKGEVVELTDGDKFFLAPKECLLTVGIKHIKSGDDDTALQLTPDAGQFNVHYDKSVANEVVSPKATQNDQGSAIGHLQQSELPQTGASARWLCAEVQVPTTDGCLTGDISNVDPTRLKCSTCSVDGCSICNAVDDALDHPLPGSQVSLISNCSIGEAAFLKTVASGDLPLIGTTTSIVASKTSVVPDGQSAPGVQGLAESPTTDGRCCTSSQGGAQVAVEERDCGPSIDSSGEILVQCLQPDASSGRFDLRGPLNGVEVDHNDVDQASKQIISSNATGGLLPALLSEPNQIQENKTSADICRVELKQEQSQRWQPGHSSNLSHISSPLPFPCNSDVAVGAFFGNTVLQDIREKEGNVHSASTSEPAPSSDRRSVDPTCSELPVAGEECKLLDGRRMPAKQLGLVDLTTPENKVQVQSQIQSQTVHTGPCMPNIYGVGPVKGMETVTATVSGYDNVLRVRLVNLINLTGAAYTGSLTKSNTHVVCWKFKGAKYELARKLGKTILNHRWFEDCLRAGVRLPEGPYESSGKEAEPLYWSYSSVQHPPSKACEQHSDSLFMEEHSQGLLQSAIVVGGSSVPSTHTGRIVEPTGQSTLPSKCNSDKLDKGKRHSVVDLNNPANRLQVFDVVTMTHDHQDVCQIRSPTRARNAAAIDLSTPHGAQEQESDEFWNEVIRAYDNKGKQVADHTCQVLPETLPSAELNHHRARRARHASSPNAGSSSGELDTKVDDEIIHGGRDVSDNEAHAYGDIESERLHEAMQSHLSMREQSGTGYSEDGHRTRHPKVLLRKRKHVPATLSGQINGKHRRLVRKREILGEPDEISDPVGCLVTMGGIRTGDQSNFVRDSTQQKALKVDRKDEYEQSAGLIDSLTASASKTGEKVGESLSDDEITCVICHSETKLVTEGVLTCGHKFCYPCIQRWADEAKSKSPTCPLCKVSFEFITYREMGKAAANGSCSSVLEERVVEIGQDTRQEARHTNLPSLRTENLCVTCGSRDTSELLLRCTNCRERACHTFCLDPPRPPGSSWFCSRCSQTQSRMQTREAYGRLFQGSSPRSSLRRRSDMGDLGLNPVTQNGFTSRVGALVPGQSSRSPPRRGRQHSLYSYLVRHNDV